MSEKPRLSYVGTERAASVVALRLNHVRRIRAELEAEPARLRQRRVSLLLEDLTSIGASRYALGADVAECREPLSEGVSACIELFRLRGRQEVFPVLDLVVDPSKPKGDPDRARLTRRHEPGTKDYSLTNSKDGYWHVCLALGIDEQQKARELAAMIWDPPDADYIGRRSTVCTPNDQALAYALRHFLADEPQEAASALCRVRTLPGDYVGLQAELLRCVMRSDASGFVVGLSALLARHEQLSRRDPWNPKLYICVPALGLTALALAAGFVTAEQAPRNVYLPLGFLGR